MSLFLVAAVALQLPDATVAPPEQAAPDPTPQIPVATAPRLTAPEINRQDRVSPRHRRRETRAFDERPLLAALPLELGGVRIEIAGLAADGRTAILTIASGHRGRRYARALYRRVLLAYADPGTAYRLRWVP